jgi:chitinase
MSYANIVKLIKKLRVDFGEEFIITLAPVASSLKKNADGTYKVDTFSGFEYSTLEKEHSADIDWYNVQFYSGFGSMKSITDYEAIVAECPLDPSRIVALTLSSASNGSGFVELNTVKKTMRKLLQKYGNRFGGIGAWEYSQSKPDTDELWTWAAVMKVAMVNYKDVLALE